MGGAKAEGTASDPWAAAVRKCHGLGRLATEKSHLTVPRPEVGDEVIGRASLPLKPVREGPSWPHPASGGCQLPPLTDASLHPCLRPHVATFPVRVSLYCKDAQHSALGAHLLQRDS